MRLPVPEQSVAILVGASSYVSPDLDDLPSVANNLVDLYGVLTNPTFCNFRTENCRINPSPRLPDVGIAIEVAAQQAQDALIVYYAGHGIPLDGGELYLAVGATIPEFAAHTALSFALLRRALANSPARTRILILDCCFSGRAIEAMADPSSLIAGQTEVAGTYTMTSAGRNVPAVAPRGSRHTAFTGALLEIVQRGVADGPELLSVGHVYRLLRHSQIVRGFPEPQQRGTGMGDQFTLVRNVAKSGAPVPSFPPRRPADELASPRVRLEQMIENMRTFEREHRTRLHNYLDDQLLKLEALLVRRGVDGSDDTQVYDELRRFAGEHDARLNAYLLRQRKDLEAGSAYEKILDEPLTDDKRRVGELRIFAAEYRRRLRSHLDSLHSTAASIPQPRRKPSTPEYGSRLKAYIVGQLSELTGPSATK